MSWANWQLGRPQVRGTGVAAAPSRKVPSAPEFGTGAWWDTPNLRFNDMGQAWDSGVGAYRTLQSPGWIRDPRTFYGVYQSAPQEYRPALVANAQSAYDAEQNDLQQVGRGRNWLTNQQGEVQRAASSWASDPYRELVLSSLEERAGPDYQFFTPGERTAATAPIGQGYARNLALMEADTARRGTYGGGGEINDRAAMRTLADTGAAQVRAQIDASERELKNQALATLANTTAQYNAADAAYVNAGNQLAGALASLEAGVDFEPTDYTVWPTLAEATTRADSEAAFRNEALAAMEREAKFGVQDLAQLLLSTSGTGFWDLVL